MLIGAEHTALEYAEIAFDGVGGDLNVAFVADVFVLLMVDRIVARELSAKLLINSRLIRHQVRLFGNVGADDGRNLVNGRVRNVEAADLAGIAIKQRKNRVLMSRASASLLNALDAANVRFVNFYRAASIAHGRDKAANAHCFTQAVHKKPSRFVADAQHAVDLM